MEYPKINTIWMRDEKGKIIEGSFSCPEFKYLQNCQWSFTEKVDGTNIRVIWQEGKVSFGGKTDNAQIPAFLLKKLQELFPVEKFVALYPDQDMCLYGEGYGAKIQKGGGSYIKDGCDFVLFDVLVGNWWLERHNISEVGCKLGITVIPEIGQGNLGDMVRLCQKGFSSVWGQFPAEGIVAKPLVDLFNRKHERVITKLKVKDYLKK